MVSPSYTEYTSARGLSSRWYVDISVGGKRKVLPEATQQQFLQKEFVSFEFESLSPEQEEDLFARVQMGVQLTAAEKMRASTGPWQELARMFVDDFPVIFSLLKDCSRAKDFQLVLSCFSQILEVQNPTPANGIPILRTNYHSLPKLLKNKDAVDDGIKSHLASVFTTFRDLVEQDPNTFTNGDKRLRGVQTFAPIELIAVACLISQYSDTRNNKLLLGDILALRENLREHFVDLRANAPTWKHIWEYIDELERIRGAVDGTTIKRDVDMRPASRTLSPAVQQPIVTPAAPVAKKGRPTARTKPANVAPGSTQVTVAPKRKPTPVQVPVPTAMRLEEGPPTSLIKPPCKRTKLDQDGTGKNPSRTSRPVPSGAGSSTEDPMVLDDSPALDIPLHHKKPNPPAVTMSQPPKVQKARRSVQAPLPVLTRALNSGSGRALLPEQARRERIAAYTCNTPNTPMAPASKGKAPASATNESRRFSLNTTSQAGDKYQELSNAADVPTPVVLLHRNKSAGIVPQVNGAIDLTDDNAEQERQSLLTQFSASKNPKSKPKPKAPAMDNGVGIGERQYVEPMDIDGFDELRLPPNPHARNKKSLNPHRSGPRVF
jgi:hypothetical protein